MIIAKFEILIIPQLSQPILFKLELTVIKLEVSKQEHSQLGLLIRK